jgi:hypothetical protein
MAGVATGIPIFIRHLGETLSIPVPGDGTVTDAKIATGAVTDAKIATGAVTDAKIADMSATKLTGTIDGARFPATLPVADGSALTNLPTSLDGSPDTNNTATGPQTNTFASGYTASITDLVVLGNASKWVEADANATATSIGLLGIALESKNDTQLMNVALSGSFIYGAGWS